MLGEKVAGKPHVAERLRHLLAVELDEAVVQPIAREGLAAVPAGALSELVLVVWKEQVDATAVNIDRLAEMRCRHRRALDVPAGPAAAPGAVPTDDLRLRRFPEHEVARV